MMPAPSGATNVFVGASAASQVRRRRRDPMKVVNVRIPASVLEKYRRCSERDLEPVRKLMRQILIRYAPTV